MSIQRPSAELPDRLGWLLKHAYLRFAELSDGAVAPFGVTARQVAVMRAIHRPQPQAQGDVARQMGIDRTTMVALVDELQDKNLVRRRPDAADRRKNVVELTDAGRAILQQANQAAAQSEQEFLRPLSAGQADQLRSALRALLS
jgi:DNA-binding MarR family transcriptional regulator